MKALTNKEFIIRATKIYGNKYDYSLVNYINSDTKVKLICLKHGDFERRPLKFLAGRECLLCKKEESKFFGNTKKLDTKEFIKRSKEIFGNKYEYSKVKYVNYKTKVTISCSKHGDFEIVPNYHLSDKCGCQKCAKESIADKNTITKKEFIKKAKLVHGDRYDYSKIEYVNMSSKINLNCKKHGAFNVSTLHHIHSEVGCSKCKYELISEKTRDTLSDFLTKSKKTHKNKYDYSLVEYKNPQTKVTILCKKHGNFKQAPAMHIYGQGCPACKESKGERSIRNFLSDNKIKFESQKRFNECKNKRCLPFDFYLPNINTCIEINGTQHYKMSTYFGQDSFDKTQINDKIKKDFCESNNIKLIIIKYNENIENLLKTLL